MIIKKLEIGYGGILSQNYEITKDGHELVYRFGRHHTSAQFVRTPDTWEWRTFAHAVTPMVKEWKKEYFNESRNGVQWRVNIETTEGYFYSCGSNEFPENFNIFLAHCRNILRRNDFAKDYLLEKASSHYHINPFNKRIMRLLHSSKKSILQLSDFLRTNPEVVRRQLHSTETFAHKDLIKICHFLNELPSDFVFETSLQCSPSILREIKHNAENINAIVQETQQLIIDYFERTFASN